MNRDARRGVPAHTGRGPRGIPPAAPDGMRSRVTSCLVLALALAGGCATDEDVEVEDVDGKGDTTARPIGTFWRWVERTDGDSGGIHLSLMTTMEFRNYENDDPFVGATISRGTYKYSKSGAKRFITLTEGDLVNKYEYTFAADVLRMKHVNSPTGDWLEYKRDTYPMCDSYEDCEAQNVPDGDCEGDTCRDR